MAEEAAKRFPQAAAALAKHVRLVEDFPEDGVVFQDLTPVLADAEAFHVVVDALAEAAVADGAEVIGGLDARGFLLGAAVAYKLEQGVLAIRKAGKLPPPVHREDYALEYGTAALEIPADAIDVRGKKVVLVDDVLATGGTLAAATSLLHKCGAEVVGYVVVLEVEGLGGREKIGDVPLTVIAQA
ncbi:adenine phosphoribosyltransferase [Corynebacterium atypicum]|uniref:Adenine phosphoribosyltransferase n=1 Tax=Corynebacterium atypicum TaxID=191610 RepID=A0ABN4DCB7_9CORY|nr:adenine phosphoribosyltransferase [Corynebacterium atypicum]AIG64050.1 adenine phosphoribosyltransferase [Corynebacterium atypicum]